MGHEEANDIKIEKLTDFILYDEDENHPEIVAFRFFIVGFTLSKVIEDNKEENFNIFVSISEKLKKHFAPDPTSYHLLNNRMSEYSKVLQEMQDIKLVAEMVGLRFQQYTTYQQSSFTMKSDKVFNLYSKKVISIFNNPNDKTDQPSLATKITILLSSALVVAIAYLLGIPNAQPNNTDSSVTTTTQPSVPSPKQTEGSNNTQTFEQQPNSSLTEEELQKSKLQIIHLFAKAFHKDTNAEIKLIEQNPKCSQPILHLSTLLGENWENVNPEDKIVLTNEAINSWECLGNKTKLTTDKIVTNMDNLLLLYPNDKVITFWNLFHAIFQYELETNKK